MQQHGEGGDSRGFLRPRYFRHLAVDLGGGCLAEPGVLLEAEQSDGLKNAKCSHPQYQEQVHTIKQFQPVCVAVMRTLASVQVVVEAFNKLLGQTRDRYAFVA